jgi:hypothetical protein
MSSKRRRRKAASAVVVRASEPSTPQGPVMPEAKPRTAPSVCLSNESAAEFTQLYHSLIAEHAPATTTGHLLVEEMAVCRWRLQRAWVMETALVDNQMDVMESEVAKTYESTDEPTRATLAFRKLTENSPALDVLHRYETRLSRQFERCLKRLETMRAVASRVELPREPNPRNEHSEHALQLQHHHHPAPAAQPTLCNERESSVAPPEPTSGMDAVCRQVRRPDPDSLSGGPPVLPRAA